ncbi:hypothetical protein M422DRAFT_238683 [Sphaerobolus stellatus SS14]|nr:hypothetical protein M422DRAFT_238683 [Sphaerobolus stellatus SS14]
MKTNIKNVPPEILENILFESLPPLFDTPDGLPRLHGLTSFDGVDDDEAKQNIMATCKEWRDTLHRFYKPWTRLEIDLCALMKEPGRLGKLLARSGTMPINVKLIFMAEAMSETVSRRRHREVQYIQPSSSFAPQACEDLRILRKELHRIRTLAIGYTSLEYRELVIPSKPIYLITEIETLLRV